MGWIMEEGRGSAMLKRWNVLFVTIALLCINMIGLSVCEEEKVSLLTDLVDAVMPGTVYIQTYDSDDRQMSAGSGFFVNDEGYVVTCNHVVEDETENCNLTRKFAYAKVTTSDSKQYAALPIIYDPEGDLVICKLVDTDISDSPMQALPISTSYPKVGEDIFVIGAPENNRFSVTKGIISSISRKLSELPHLKTAFQIDASVLPGSSGGPVFNMDGEIVGIVRSTEGPGVNFVIPAERIEDLISMPSAAAPGKDFEMKFDDIVFDVNSDFLLSSTALEAEDGNLIVSAFLNQKNETILANITLDGDREWFREYRECQITSVQMNDDGGYILAGASPSLSGDGAKATLIKVDSDGYKIWSRSYGEPDKNMGFLSVEDTGDGYVMAGFKGDREGNRDSLLMKTDSNGEVEWSRTFGEPEYRGVASSAEKTMDGDFVLLELHGSDSSLMKVDSTGNELWNRTYDNCVICSFQETTDKGFILAGFMDLKNPFVTDACAALLIKTDKNGCPVWSRILFASSSGDSMNSRFFSVRQTSDGGYILGGMRDWKNRGTDIDGWVVKTDSRGNEVWNESLGGLKLDAIFSAQQADDGGYILAGATSSYRETLIDDDPVMWLIRLEG